MSRKATSELLFGTEDLVNTSRLGFNIGAGVDENSYDIVRWPSFDGTAKPTGVAASYLAINAKTADPDAAMKFLTSFLDTEGQKLRLEGHRQRSAIHQGRR